MSFPLVLDRNQLAELFNIELVEVFHRANNVLPEGQVLLSLEFNTPVSEAFTIMERENYSQIPIVAGNQALGLFSYRSFAHKIDEYCGEKVDLENFRVGDFIEQIDFLDILDDWTKFLDELEAKDAILVGNRSNLLGLISSIDVVRYLFKITSPFILLGEIEKAIRAIIRNSITERKFLEIVSTTLSHQYEQNEMPSTLEEMNFNDYIQIIGHGDSWQHFEEVFGSNRLHRNRTRTKLEEIRDIRNDVFHFRREINYEDIQKLIAYRDWIKNLLTARLSIRRNENNVE